MKVSYTRKERKGEICLQAKMPKAAKKTGKARKKPSQQEAGDVVGAAATDGGVTIGQLEKLLNGGL